jgi:hypothetical protein
MIALGLKPELVMDDRLLLYLYHRLFHHATAHPPRRCLYSDAIIVLIYFLAVLRDRSPRWACDRRNWPLWMRRLRCPSYSQFIRRLKAVAVQRLLEQLNEELHARLPQGREKVCDGKPLVVGGFSKDPDSASGRLPGDGWGRGYKVHVIIDASGAVDAFAVTALDGGEATVTRRLVKAMNLRGIMLRGDSNYDSNPLYRVVAARGGRLMAPRKKPHTGLGHRPHHPDRLRAIAELEGSADALRAHDRQRIRVEQGLGHLTNLPFGLCPLPNFVRRQRRVRRWVLGKITLYHLYLNLRNQQALAA